MARTCMHFNVPESLSKAVSVAARVRMISAAGYVRGALLDRLAADGIDLARLDDHAPEQVAQPVAAADDDPLDRLIASMAAP